MNKYRSTIFFKDLVTGFLLIYLFYALANLFFIPSYSFVNSNASFSSHAGIVKQTLSANHGSIGCVRLSERSIIDEDQLSNSKLFPICFQAAFDRFTVFRVKTVSLFTPTSILHNFRHSYLSFCILRI